MGRGPFTGNSERYLKGGSGNGASLFMGGGGGSSTGDPEGYVEQGSGVKLLSIMASMGNLEGGLFTRDFERWMRQVSLSTQPRWGTCGGKSVYQEC
jgi:hypothetical protein